MVTHGVLQRSAQNKGGGDSRDPLSHVACILLLMLHVSSSCKGCVWRLLVGPCVEYETCSCACVVLQVHFCRRVAKVKRCAPGEERTW